MLICLHVGAHETASGYIRARLMAERERIAARKVGVVAPRFYRAKVSEPLDAAGRDAYAKAKPGISRYLARMVALHAGQDRLILPDETLAGAALPPSAPGGLYADIRARLAVVLGAAPRGHEVEVLFCVRSYEAFFNSLHVLRAERRSAHDIEAFRERALGIDRGWADVVADISSVAGAERTVVWTYEDLVAQPTCVSRALLGEAAPKVFLKSEGAFLPSVSRKGYAVLDRAADMLSPTERVGVAGAVSRLAFDPPDEPFSLFDADESAAFAARYRRDLADIAASGCRLVTRDAAPEAVSTSAA
ncbi:hypothetical protein [Methylopila sp. M107]|uniref:hypothetical protein n=1 Tax=Methylopila sp. M107 TaxID=1101190 RepID=UPI00037ED692|nr:hypothetical protein [Methylopila sp. M107]